MNKKDIKAAIATLSESNISPYDLLIAIGEDDFVPQEIIEDRKTRVITRDKSESSEGYIRNAIEDLEKQEFKGKEEVLKLLRSNIRKPLAGLGSIENPSFKYLHAAFTLTPILAGADKFFNFTTDWSRYLAPQLVEVSPISPKKLMYLIGGVEMLMGMAIALQPETGGKLLAGYLSFAALNILISGKNYDVLLKDIGLVLSCIAMINLAKSAA